MFGPVQLAAWRGIRIITTSTSSLAIRPVNPFPDQHLAAPGPQNLGSPRLTLAIPNTLLDETVGAAVAPNRIRQHG